MIGTPSQAAERVCPLLAIASGKQTRCAGPGCQLWTWHAAPTIRPEGALVFPDQPVGGCSLAGEPTHQHWMVALGKWRPRTGRVLQGMFPADKLNQPFGEPHQPPAPPPEPDAVDLMFQSMAKQPEPVHPDF